MMVIEFLLILVLVGVVLYFIRRKHRHVWVYTSSARDNSYNMFYCPKCMRYSKASFNDNGNIVVRVYEVKKPRRK